MGGETMINSMACICGGVGEVLLLGAIASGIGFLWRKLRGKKAHKHGEGCKH